MAVIGGGEASDVLCCLSSSTMSVAFLPAVVDPASNLSSRVRSGGLEFGHGRGEVSTWLAKARSDDACGCRVLVGGRCFGLGRVSCLAPGETLVLVRWNRQRRRQDVVSFMKALPWLLTESSELELGPSWFSVWVSPQGMGLQGAMYAIANTPSTSSSSGLARPCHPLANFSRRYEWGGTLTQLALCWLSWLGCVVH